MARGIELRMRLGEKIDICDEEWLNFGVSDENDELFEWKLPGVATMKYLLRFETKF